MLLLSRSLENQWLQLLIAQLVQDASCCLSIIAAPFEGQLPKVNIFHCMINFFWRIPVVAVKNGYQLSLFLRSPYFREAKNQLWEKEERGNKVNRVKRNQWWKTDIFSFCFQCYKKISLTSMIKKKSEIIMHWDQQKWNKKGCADSLHTNKLKE